MTETDQTEWLSLSEASELIGVHPSTLRRWADAGTIPCARTPGGHRRFRREVLSQYLATKEQTEAQFPSIEPELAQPRPSTPETVDFRAMIGREWHAPFVEADVVDRLRPLGQRLLGLLLQYVTTPEPDERFLQEGHDVGYDYGYESYVANIGLLDAVEAFLYFRTNFTQRASQMPLAAQFAPGQSGVVLHQRTDRFMDAVLLGLIEAYEEARGYTTELEQRAAS
ncbi:MAG: helix-turn-helix domain-containing protein [Chloroflexi bacterium]|nr:MAG: helix-turn-helix domain-containing protein [Chloroflexota bacterium]